MSLRIVGWGILLVAMLSMEGATAAAVAGRAAVTRSAERAKAPLLDINRASREDLVALPGVGEAYADRIVAGRPYARKDELRTRKIVPPAVYRKIAKRIIAKQP